MPPKKKEEEVDLASLPECQSINVVVLVRGKKSRAEDILRNISKEAEKYLFRVRKNEVLEHAKEKNIYVDPATLTDKQKKDPKFMESICTELTPEVLAKAVQSHLSALKLKARMEKKNSPAHFANEHRKYDLLITFEDFPQTREEHEELARLGEPVKYVLVVEPRVTWANAPEVGEPEEGEEEEEEAKEYRALVAREEKTEQDLEFEKGVDGKIERVRKLRRESSVSSQFRNCTISVVEADIDPYNEPASLNQVTKAFFDHIIRLEAEYLDFQEWKKGKTTEPLPSPSNIQPMPKTSIEQGSIVSMLHSLARTMDEPSPSGSLPSDHQEDALDLISSFTAGKKNKKDRVTTVSKNQSRQYVAGNQEGGADSLLREELRREMKYPGVNRHLMPETPAKSYGLRKLEQSHYSAFLPGDMTLEQFERRQRLLNFQEFLREFDEDRNYSLEDRIYEEQHEASSLKRELDRAGEKGEASAVWKYDEASDKLYLVLLYRNNSRRASRKAWENSWKVVPNFENWLKFFKNNENNLANSLFYDLDYERIGNIEELCRTYTLRNGLLGAVIVSKQCTAGNATQNMLYSIKNELAFGVNHSRFYAQHENLKVFHHRTAQPDQYETVVLLQGRTVRVSSSGTLTFEQGPHKRLITPQGFTLLYHQDGAVILHPNGTVTYGPDTYVNERGLGLKQGRLFSSLALERTAAKGKVLKREDGTVIVSKEGQSSQKWIKFYEGTEYQTIDGEIRIQKAGLPFVTCCDGCIKVVAPDIVINVESRDGAYRTTLRFKDGSLLTLDQADVLVSQTDGGDAIQVNVDRNEIRSAFGDEEVVVNETSALYGRNGKVVDANEEEQKLSEDEVLPGDCIEPRLFVINNDSTGVELLSGKVVEGYLGQHQSTIYKVEETKKGKQVEVQIIEKLNKTEAKQIKKDVVINLDVFDNSLPEEPPPTVEQVAIRNLIKYSPLSPQDLPQIAKIRAEVEAWRKTNSKEENQFGHKARDNDLVKSITQAKLLMIKTRQQKEATIDTSVLHERGKAIYEAALAELKKKEEAQEREDQLRRQYLKKKNSVIIDYRKVPLQEKKAQVQEDEADEPGPFLDHYFMTCEGKKALSEMPEWVFRPKEIKVPPELDPEIKNELNNTNHHLEEDNSEENRQRYDTVEVNLNPRPQKEILIKPSVFTQREIDEERTAFESEKKAYKYHEVKRKDFNVYGQERRSRPEVRTLLRTQAISEINQKYLVTEAPLDKKVKISSMRNKLTSSASSMAEMRKEGPHSLLMKTLDKGNDVNKLLEKRTMMVQADLNDKLQRDILINPVEANFGVLLERRTYELKIQIKNEDIISQRITLKRPKSVYAKVSLSEMGPIAMGMTRKVVVTLRTVPELLGKFSDQFDIVTKHEVYHIPIAAQIMSEGQLKSETLSLSRGVVELEETFKKKGEGSIELPRLK